MARRTKFFVHPKALVDTAEIGEGTRVWAFSHVMKGARLGKNCNIGEHCFIEHGVEVGDDAVIKNGVSLWEGVKIESKVFVGPNAVFTNDKIPRAKLFREEYERTVVREGASVGANATLLSRHRGGRVCPDWCRFDRHRRCASLRGSLRRARPDPEVRLQMW